MQKPLPVTASVTTLAINTVLSRPPPVVQVARLPAAQLNPSASLTSDPRLETLLGASAHTEPQTRTLIEELRSPVVPMEDYLNENTAPSTLNLHSTNMDNMDWLDLTLSVPAEGVNSLDISAPAGVFSSDFLDSHELHLNWDWLTDNRCTHHTQVQTHILLKLHLFPLCKNRRFQRLCLVFPVI